jgi:hypothetical protein
VVVKKCERWSDTGHQSAFEWSTLQIAAFLLTSAIAITPVALITRGTATCHDRPSTRSDYDGLKY